MTNSLIDKAVKLNELIRAKYPGVSKINTEAFKSLFTDYNRENAYLLNLLVSEWITIDYRQVISYEGGKLILCPFKADKVISKSISYYSCHNKP